MTEDPKIYDGLVPAYHGTYLDAVGDDLEKMVKILGYFLYRNSPTYEYDNADRRAAEAEARELLAGAMKPDDDTGLMDPDELQAHRRLMGEE